MKLTKIDNAEQSIEIDATLEPTSLKSQWLPALRKFLLFTGIAILSILIPVAHFVLVPTFSLVAVIVFFKVLTIKHRLKVSGDYKCIRCDANIEFPESLSNNYRIKCKNCFQQYKVSI